MLRAVTVFVLTIVSAFAADITGKWTGTWGSSREGQRRTGQMKFVFQQEGERLTGNTFSKDGDRVTLENGRIQGDSIRFELPDGDVIVKVNLTWQGEQLTGEAVRERDGKQQIMTLALERDRQ